MSAIYQDSFDHERFSNLYDIDFGYSSHSIEAVNQVNLNVYYQKNCKERCNSFNGLQAAKLRSYHELLNRLLARELTKEFPQTDNKNSHTWHNVDATIISRLPTAKVKADLEIKSTYHTLPTSPYYGTWAIHEVNSIFKYNTSLGNYHLNLQKCGYQMDTHTDPLLIYQNYNCNGFSILRDQLSWPNEFGLEILGYVQHKYFKRMIRDGKWAALNQLYAYKRGLSFTLTTFMTKYVVG